MTRKPDDLANHEIVTIAVYLEGGDMKSVDTEDVAIKAAEIAPGRFSWRKYPEQINLNAVYKRLWDACLPDKGGYLVGSEKDGWRLTDAGMRFAIARAKQLDVISLRRPLSLREKRWRSRERERMMASDAYRRFNEGTSSELIVSDAERFFRIDEHVGLEQRRARVERSLVFFGDDEDLGDLVRLMASLVLGENPNEQ